MSDNTETAILAGGCFWGVQELLRKRDGIISTRVGYTGGENDNPTYPNHPGHAEAVEIVFDPELISYRDILEFFFQIHDPTTKDRQGNDVGSSYRSEIFVTSDEQREVAEETIADVDASGLWPGKVVTEISDAVPFWEAEPEHQDYLQRIPNGYTCHYPRPGLEAAAPRDRGLARGGGLLQVRLVDAGDPVRIQTRVDRFLSSSHRVDVGTIGGEPGRHLGTFGNGAVAGDHDIDVPGGLTQPVQRRLVGAHLIVLARVEDRDQDVGEHVAGEQDATVGEEDRGVADGVRLMLDDLARHGSAVRGQRGDERDQLERDVPTASSAAPSCCCSRVSPANLSAGGGGVARHVAEPVMPEQVVPVGMGGEPGDHRNAEPVHVIGELVQLGSIDAGIDQDQPVLRAHHDGIGPDPLALPDPDAVGHLIQLAHLHSNRSFSVQPSAAHAETAIRGQNHRSVWPAWGRTPARCRVGRRGQVGTKRRSFSISPPTNT